MAMLTDRVFLLEMTYPVNLLQYIAPNAVQWDAAVVPRSIVTHDLYGPARIRKYWSNFAKDLLTNGGTEMIEFRSNEGFVYFYPEILKSPEILKRFMSLGADNRTNYAGLYGCAAKFLFNLRPLTTWAVTSQLTNLGLVTGKYVSVHIRTSISSLDCGPRHATPIEWKKFLECAVGTSHFLAKKLRLESVPIYLASDEDVVKEYAMNNFSSQVVLSQVRHFCVHIYVCVFVSLCICVFVCKYACSLLCMCIWCVHNSLVISLDLGHRNLSNKVICWYYIIPFSKNIRHHFHANISMQHRASSTQVTVYALHCFIDRGR